MNSSNPPTKHLIPQDPQCVCVYFTFFWKGDGKVFCIDTDQCGLLLWKQISKQVIHANDVMHLRSHVRGGGQGAGIIGIWAAILLQIGS